MTESARELEIARPFAFRPRFTIALSVGRWGGVYLTRRVVFRICLGFVAITAIPFDVDDVLRAGLDALAEEKP